MLLHVACNDPDNGQFIGRAPQLSIKSEITFMAHNWEGSRFREADDAIFLAGKRWPTCGAKDWVGNWCWNAYTLSDGTRTQRWWLTDFIIWLRGRDLYHMDMGPSPLFNWFNKDGLWAEGGDLAPVRVHALICDVTT